MAWAAANQSAGFAFPLSSNSELLAAYSLIISLRSLSAVWTWLIAKCCSSSSHSLFALFSVALCSGWMGKVLKKGAGGGRKEKDGSGDAELVRCRSSTLSCNNAARPGPEQRWSLSRPPPLFWLWNSITQKDYLGTARRTSPRFISGTFLALLLGTVATINTRKHGNCQNNWTFSLAVDRGGGWSEASLVFGGDEEQVERGGRGFRVGGGLVVWGLRTVVGYASATCLAWHLLLLDWKDVVDGESGWARPASLSTKRGVSAATPHPVGDKTPFSF